MKKSQVFVLAAAGIIVLAMVILIGIGRLAIGKAEVSGSDGDRIEWSEKSGTAAESLDLTAFTQVVIEGAWTVRIEQAEDFSTNIHY